MPLRRHSGTRSASPCASSAHNEHWCYSPSGRRCPPISRPRMPLRGLQTARRGPLSPGAFGSPGSDGRPLARPPLCVSVSESRRRLAASHCRHPWPAAYGAASNPEWMEQSRSGRWSMHTRAHRTKGPRLPLSAVPGVWRAPRPVWPVSRGGVAGRRAMSCGHGARRTARLCCPPRGSMAVGRLSLRRWACRCGRRG